MIRTESILVKETKELNLMLSDSRAIYDQSLYFLRQAYFETKKLREEDPSLKIKTPSFNELYKLVKETLAFKDSLIDYNSKVLAIQQAFDMWKSFIRATVAYNKNNKSFSGRPLMPKYLARAKKEFNVVTISSGRLQERHCKENEIRLPKSSYKIKIPHYINKKSIKCLRILKFYDKIKIEIVYEKQVKIKEYENNHSIGIDLGVNNLMAITSNEQNLSWLVNGRPLKAMNQYYNKKLASLNCVKATKKIKKLNKKRKLKVDNYLHWASKKVIDLSLENQISAIVIGKNKGWKNESSMGSMNNQNFVQIPHARLIQMISYKAAEVGIDVLLTEESYTSKIDHLAFEEMTHKETYMGKRTKRGQFKSSLGQCLNADINGAIGILRKKKVISDVQLMNLRNRGDVVSPKKLLKVS